MFFAVLKMSNGQKAGLPRSYRPTYSVYKLIVNVFSMTRPYTSNNFQQQTSQATPLAFISI